MVKLSVPYRSQWDEDANTHSADCGPTCVAMILNFKQVNITPNKVYNFIPPKTSGQFTTFTDLIKSHTRQQCQDRLSPLRQPNRSTQQFTQQS